MVTSSRYLTTGSPIGCAFCNEAFRPRDGYVEFWRTSDGKHFCSEFCADDAEETSFESAVPPRARTPARHCGLHPQRRQRR